MTNESHDALEQIGFDFDFNPEDQMKESDTDTQNEDEDKEDAHEVTNTDKDEASMKEEVQEQVKNVPVPQQTFWTRKKISLPKNTIVAGVTIVKSKGRGKKLSLPKNTDKEKDETSKREFEKIEKVLEKKSSHPKKKRTRTKSIDRGTKITKDSATRTDTEVLKHEDENATLENACTSNNNNNNDNNNSNTEKEIKSNHTAKAAEQSITKVDPKRKKALDNQNKLDEIWYNKLNEVAEFQKEHGCLPNSKDKTLQKWVSNHRRNIGSYTPDRQEALGKLGIFTKKSNGSTTGGNSHKKAAEIETTPSKESTQNKLDAMWYNRLNEVAEFQKEHGCLPNSNDKDTTLLTWVSNQRRYIRIYTPDRQEALRKVGFFTKKSNGSTSGNSHEKAAEIETTPSKESTTDSTNVDLDIRRKIPSANLSKTNAEPNKQKGGRKLIWDQRFEELTSFKTTHGHCDLPKDVYANINLFKWVAAQRCDMKNYLKGEASFINPDRYLALSRLGVEIEGSWHRNLKDLIAFQSVNKHCDVKTKPNNRLYRWTGIRRKEYKKFHEVESQGDSVNIAAQNREKVLTLLGFNFHYSGKSKSTKPTSGTTNADEEKDEIGRKTPLVKRKDTKASRGNSDTERDEVCRKAFDQENSNKRIKHSVEGGKKLNLNTSSCDVHKEETKQISHKKLSIDSRDVDPPSTFLSGTKNQELRTDDGNSSDSEVQSPRRCARKRARISYEETTSDSEFQESDDYSVKDYVVKDHVVKHNAVKEHVVKHQAVKHRTAKLRAIEDIRPNALLPSKPLPINPLNPPDSVPTCPSTEFCKWSFDETSRVLLANFVIKDGNIHVTNEDELFLHQMMERTDITVISENLALGLNQKLWNLSYIRNFVGSEYHHKVRRFDRIKSKSKPNRIVENIAENAPYFHEVDGFLQMKISDFIDYLEKRSKIDDKDDPNFTFSTFDKKDDVTINVNDTGLYMVDLDVVKLLPRCYDDFMKTFRLTSLLPGGDHCMLNAVNSNGRPFMGPNLYVTPPAAFTHFHQDGFGTVDSGHLCLSGYNEVVMLRRLNEKHKENALQILNGGESTDSPPVYDALYGLPHSDGEKPPWPSHHMIEKCQKMNYCPSVFILKPGQWVHINKGRLHAFRKMATSKLPDDDCHRILRSKLISECQLSNDITCISIAWDWMYRGITPRGIDEELGSTLTCVALARAKGRQSLAIPETAIFRLAKSLLSEYAGDKNIISIPSATSLPDSIPSAIDLINGILPSLRKIVNRHTSAYTKIKDNPDSIRDSYIPNSWQNPETFTIDPYGDCDFFCKICFQELSNIYMHCDGCEKLLNKDFNICTGCYFDNKHLQNIQMHPQKNDRHSTLNHTGAKFDRQKRCLCKRGLQCLTCLYCLGCSCKCHTKFSLNYRFMSIDDEKDILDSVQTIADQNNCLVSNMSTDIASRNEQKGNEKKTTEVETNNHDEEKANKERIIEMETNSQDHDEEKASEGMTSAKGTNNQGHNEEKANEMESSEGQIIMIRMKREVSSFDLIIDCSPVSKYCTTI